MMVRHDHFSDDELGAVRLFLLDSLLAQADDNPEYAEVFSGCSGWAALALAELTRRCQDFIGGLSCVELIALANGQLDLPAAFKCLSEPALSVVTS